MLQGLLERFSGKHQENGSSTIDQAVAPVTTVDYVPSEKELIGLSARGIQAVAISPHAVNCITHQRMRDGKSSEGFLIATSPEAAIQIMQGLSRIGMEFHPLVGAPAGLGLALREDKEYNNANTDHLWIPGGPVDVVKVVTDALEAAKPENFNFEYRLRQER